MENNHFFVVTIGAPQIPIRELIERATSLFNCSGIEEFSLDEPMVDEILGDRAYSGGDLPLAVLDEVDEACSKSYKFYFDKQNCEKDVEEFQNYLASQGVTVSKVERKKVEDWNEKWRESYRPIEVSSELIIIPSWEKVENRESEIYIYPGMGFGTGGHETTYLCLKHFEDIRKNLQAGGLCLDFGCGSGILGIAAIKKLKMAVDFCDIDKNALDNCVQNLELNFEDKDLGGQRLVIRDRFKAEKKYQLVFANILENILIDEKILIFSQ